MRKRILKSAFLASRPVHLILHVTNRCNLRCRTCFVDFDNYQGKELTLKEIERISKYLGKLIWLDVGGGEPFLRDDLHDICALFDAKIGTLIGEGTLKNSILSYLAAHFASFSGVADGEFKAQSAIEEELGDAQVKFASGTTSTSSDLGSTNFGQSALTLDCTGRLALKTTAKRIQMMGLDNT